MRLSPRSPAAGEAQRVRDRDSYPSEWVRWALPHRCPLQAAPAEHQCCPRRLDGGRRRLPEGTLQAVRLRAAVPLQPDGQLGLHRPALHRQPPGRARRRPAAPLRRGGRRRREALLLPGARQRPASAHRRYQPLLRDGETRAPPPARPRPAEGRGLRGGSAEEEREERDRDGRAGWGMGPAEGWRPPLPLAVGAASACPGRGFLTSRSWLAGFPGALLLLRGFWEEKCGPLTPRRAVCGLVTSAAPEPPSSPDQGHPGPWYPASVQGCWHEQKLLQGLTLLCVPVPFSPTGCRCQALSRGFCSLHSVQEFLWVHVFTRLGHMCVWLPSQLLAMDPSVGWLQNVLSWIVFYLFTKYLHS